MVCDEELCSSSPSDTTTTPTRLFPSSTSLPADNRQRSTSPILISSAPPPCSRCDDEGVMSVESLHGDQHGANNNYPPFHKTPSSPSFPIRLNVEDIQTCLNPRQCPCLMFPNNNPPSSQTTSLPQVSDPSSYSSAPATHRDADPFRSSVTTASSMDAECFDFEFLPLERRVSDPSPLRENEDLHFFLHKGRQGRFSNNRRKTIPNRTIRDGNRYLEVFVVPRPLFPIRKDSASSMPPPDNRANRGRIQSTDSTRTLVHSFTSPTFPLPPETTVPVSSRTTTNAAANPGHSCCPCLEGTCTIEKCNSLYFPREQTLLTYEALPEEEQQLGVSRVRLSAEAAVEPYFQLPKMRARRVKKQPHPYATRLQPRPYAMKSWSIGPQLVAEEGACRIPTSQEVTPALQRCGACRFCDDVCDDETCMWCFPKKVELCRRFQNNLGVRRRPVRLSQETVSHLTRQAIESMKIEKHFTPCEVRRHSTRDDCWLMAHGLIYNATSFLPYHPAGDECILRKGGGDATQDFDFHSRDSHSVWKKLEVGKVISCVGYPGSEELAYGRVSDFVERLKCLNPCSVS